jgi:hypothetical protein
MAPGQKASMAEANWNKISAIWTIIGTVGAYVLGIAGLVLMWWLAVHPAAPPAVDPQTIGGHPSMTPAISITSWMPFLMIVLAIVGGGALHIKAARIAARKPEQPEPPPRNGVASKLKILSAWYGKADGNNKNVAPLLQQRPHDAMAFFVTNDEFGIHSPADDPAYREHKRLQVEYTYGGSYHQVSREENEFIVLPEDFRQRAHRDYLEKQIIDITQQSKDWQDKWEKERGGSSSRDQDAKHLKARIGDLESQLATAQDAIAPVRHDATVAKTKLTECEGRLNGQVELLKMALIDLPSVGSLYVLIDEARQLKTRLEQIRMEANALNDSAALNTIAQPFALAGWNADNHPDNSPLPWAVRSLNRFQTMYKEHRDRTLQQEYLTSKSVLMASGSIFPSQVTFDEAIALISDHEKFLDQKSQEIRRPYLPC